MALTPTPALPLSCAQLFTTGRVQAQLHAPVTVQVDETHLAPRIQDIALLQAGGTECVWGGTNMTDAGYDTGVTVDILPNAAADFAKRTPVAGGTPTSGTIGDASEYLCQPTGAGDWCTGDALAGNYWISFVVNDIEGTAGAGNSTVEAVLKPIAAAVKQAGGAVAEWAHPSAPFRGAVFCSDPKAAALISAAVGTTVTAGDSYLAESVLGAAQLRAGMTSCSWLSRSARVIQVTTLPSGSWAYPKLLVAPPLWTLIGHPTPFDVPNTDGALHGCGASCAALVNSHGSLVSFDIDSTLDQGEADAIVTKLSSAISTN